MNTRTSRVRAGVEHTRGRVTAVREKAQRTLLWEVWDRTLEIEFVDRSVALAGKAFVSFFPLVIVVAAFLPTSMRASLFNGRILLAQILPKHPSLPFSVINRLLTKKDLQNVIDMVYRHCGQKECVIFADRLMGLGFSQAAKAGISFGKDDLIIPVEKKEMILKTQAEVKEFERTSTAVVNAYATDPLGLKLVVGETTIMQQSVIDLAGINRRLGRASTDDFLKVMGRTINAGCAHARNGVAARLNGADFALLLPAEKAGYALGVKLLQDMVSAAAPFVDGAATGWIGVCGFSAGADVGGILSQVDLALAGAEAEGKDGIREAQADAADEMPRTADQWFSMITRALEHQWVRLISFPVVNAQGILSHRECPLRLMFDEKGEWLPAGRFLPVAERLKLTPALDLVAVGLGLRELKANPGLPGLAINLSASSLEDATFQPRLLALIAAQKEQAPRLWLEMAEGGALKHLEAFKGLCRVLNAAGCRTGLEHFGHQFSQIGQLHDLGLDYLKVDASFIRGIESNVGNATFLKGLCGIAHNIGLLVIAEGVTSAKEMDALLALGFDGATGPGVPEASATPGPN